MEGAANPAAAPATALSTVEPRTTQRGAWARAHGREPDCAAGLVKAQGRACAETKRSPSTQPRQATLCAPAAQHSCHNTGPVRCSRASATPGSACRTTQHSAAQHAHRSTGNSPPSSATRSDSLCITLACWQGWMEAACREGAGAGGVAAQGWHWHWQGVWRRRQALHSVPGLLVGVVPPGKERQQPGRSQGLRRTGGGPLSARVELGSVCGMADVTVARGPPLSGTSAAARGRRARTCTPAAPCGCASMVTVLRACSSDTSSSTCRAWGGRAHDGLRAPGGGGGGGGACPGGWTCQRQLPCASAVPAQASAPAASREAVG